MRENWNVIDAARMGERSLVFSPAYLAKLRRAIAAQWKAAEAGRAIAP